MFFKTTNNTLNFKDKDIKRSFLAGLMTGVTFMIIVYGLSQYVII